MKEERKKLKRIFDNLPALRLITSVTQICMENAQYVMLFQWNHEMNFKLHQAFGTQTCINQGKIGNFICRWLLVAT